MSRTSGKETAILVLVHVASLSWLDCCVQNMRQATPASDSWGVAVHCSATCMFRHQQMAAASSASWLLALIIATASVSTSACRVRDGMDRFMRAAGTFVVSRQRAAWRADGANLTSRFGARELPVAISDERRTPLMNSYRHRPGPKARCSI